MISKYPLLDPEDCDKLVEALNADDGKLWVPGYAPGAEYREKVKRNLEQEMGAGTEPATQAGQFVINKLLNCKFFTGKVLPKHIGRPRFNLYQDGGEYGRHSDSAFMGNNPEIRTDVSMTIFLTDPDSYQGGELVLEYTNGAVIELKEPKGMMVYYPSGTLHHVRPVTAGQRICFISWVESHIHDVQKREILSDITMLCDDMSSVDNLSDMHIRMLAIKHNLFRQWMRLV